MVRHDVLSPLDNSLTRNPVSTTECRLPSPGRARVGEFATAGVAWSLRTPTPAYHIGQIVLLRKLQGAWS